MPNISIIQSFIIVILAATVVFMCLQKYKEVPPADYCQKVFHISHQDKMDCERAVKNIRAENQVD